MIVKLDDPYNNPKDNARRVQNKIAKCLRIAIKTYPNCTNEVIDIAVNELMSLRVEDLDHMLLE